MMLLRPKTRDRDDLIVVYELGPLIACIEVVRSPTFGNVIEDAVAPVVWYVKQDILKYCDLVDQADEPQPSGGHVYEMSEDDEGWQPDQRGGVVTAEPANVARARAAGEKLPTDSGGDMEQ